MQNINTILIANRGEIASRIMRTCKKMGIKSVAVYADADKKAPFVAEADIAIHIGESSPAKSYLDQEKIIAAAKKTGADAIHPGYGFLSENAGFAEKCAQEGIIFIGPNVKAIEAMGSKSKAKTLMQAANVPTVPGYQGDDQSTENLSQQAIKIGFPVLLKAAAGGGGKGMRIVNTKEELTKSIEAAKRESLSAFGDDELIIEKYIASGRHIEFQIFGDQHDNAIHILERECTIQRRYQKVLEESPSPVLSEKLRTEMGQAAVNAAKSLNYDNAGTVEFIFDDESQNFYFLEVNTRLQVEHPVTEEVTGLDLVQMQIESAMGLPLKIQQEAIKSNGYALELRLYAEDASKDFQPVTGKIHHFEYPKVDGLRVETAVVSGSEISVFYDPMIAKLIVWDENRLGAYRKMQYVLKNMKCLGTVTNQQFLLHLVQNKEVIEGKYDTHFIAEKLNLSELFKNNKIQKEWSAIAASLYAWQERENQRKVMKKIPSGWRNNFYEHQKEEYKIFEEDLLLKYKFNKGNFEILIGENTYHVELIENKENNLQVNMDGVIRSFTVIKSGINYYIHNDEIGNVTLQLKEKFPEKETEKVAGGYESPMPSTIVKVLVKAEDKVKAGDALLVISSMKMENTITCDKDGTVKEIYVTEGQNIEAGFLMLEIN